MCLRVTKLVHVGLDSRRAANQVGLVTNFGAQHATSYLGSDFFRCPVQFLRPVVSSTSLRNPFAFVIDVKAANANYFNASSFMHGYIPSLVVLRTQQSCGTTNEVAYVHEEAVDKHLHLFVFAQNEYC